MDLPESLLKKALDLLSQLWELEAAEHSSSLISSTALRMATELGLFCNICSEDGTAAYSAPAEVVKPLPYLFLHELESRRGRRTLGSVLRQFGLGLVDVPLGEALFLVR